VRLWFTLMTVIAVGSSGDNSGWAQDASGSPLGSNALQAFVSVKAFGCFGDDQHDDTPCFIAARDYLQGHTRVNTTPSSNGNRLGGVTLYVPAGTYLVTQPEAMMSHLYRTRTLGSMSRSTTSRSLPTIPNLAFGTLIQPEVHKGAVSRRSIGTDCGQASLRLREPITIASLIGIT